jgi:TrmH family RNA methyltransferase
VITSTRHPLVQTLRRLREHPRRDPERRILLDGPLLVAEALDAGVVVEAALVAADAGQERLAPLVQRLRASGARVRDAAPRVVQAASGVVATQGIVAAARRPEPAGEGILASPDLLLLVADGIQDPGNVGTMVRTALAAGATAVALTGRSADPFFPKTLRASMGAVFRIPLLRLAAEGLRAALGARGIPVLVADARADLDYTVAPMASPVAIVIGSEAAGPDPEWRASGTGVRIPMIGPVESLNAAVAAALLLYEAARCRRRAARSR